MQTLSDYTDKLAIIGAGFCGLGVAGAFQRHGIPFDILEADDALGGNWYHGVYETAHIISSRQTTQYSDYPMPEVYGDFPSAANMLAYFNAYADHHHLRPHIQFNTRVEWLTPGGDGRYEIRLANGERRVYGGVVIANGHHWDKRMPSYPGAFAGEVMHSKDYIMPKTVFGRPTVEFIQPWLPVWAQRLFIRAVIAVTFGPYERYGLPQPDHRIFEKHPTINSELLYYLKHQRITPHPDIRCLDGETVEFGDGRREPFDLIVYATGYHLSIPFLEPGIIEVKGYMPQLVGGLFHPQYKHLYYFGAGQPRYGAGPLISAGAEALALAVKAQAQMHHPVGAVLQRMGIQAPDNVLVNPHEALRAARSLQRLAPHLPQLERALMDRPAFPKPARPTFLLAGAAIGAGLLAWGLGRQRRRDGQR
jgi:hypothetical protein